MSSNTLGSASAPVDSDAAGKCPVDLETRSLWGLWGGSKGQQPPSGANASPSSSAAALPASLEEAARHAQTPQPGQRLPLSTHRLESTIPRSSTNNNRNQNQSSTPAHQIVAQHSGAEATTSSSDTWVYPSEQQVFNAMKRKGWQGIEEESIPSFLQIHNSVNERSWKELLKWEERAGIPGDSVELSRFEGRPTDLTPKAWLLSTLGLRDRPFDRHDWYVVHNNNDESDKDDAPTEQRYVLDFYMKDDDDPRFGSGLPRVEIDVRPALDSPRAFVQRGSGLLREVFPGIARELDERLRR